MKELFAPYEQALELKKLGFNEPCFSKWENYYWEYKLYPILASFGLNPPYNKESNGYNQKEINEGGYTFTGYKNNVLDHNKEIISAPLWQQAFNFFREKYNLYGSNAPLLNNEWSIVIDNVLNSQQLYWAKEETYEKARLKCLRKLIELCKKRK